MDETQEHKVELSTDRIKLEVEHGFDLFALIVIIFGLWAPCWWYDTEIRCALGSEKACATLKVEPVQQDSSR